MNDATPHCPVMNAFDRDDSVSVSMTRLAHPSGLRAMFRSACPSGCRRKGHGLGMPDEILGLVRRNRAIDIATGHHILSGTSNRAIGAASEDALRAHLI